jgi:hypothetical protein
MKVSSEESYATVVRQFTITEGNPVVPMAYSEMAKKVQVERGSISYQYRDGRWIVKNYHAIDVVGSVLKKDGTPGKSEHRRHPGSPSDWWSTWQYVPAPGWEWLQAIINLLRPVGDLSMMNPHETEVQA